MPQRPQALRRDNRRIPTSLLLVGLATLLILAAVLLVDSVGTPHSDEASGLRMELAGIDLDRSPPYLQQLAMVDDGEMNATLSFGGLSPYIGVTDWTLVFENGSWTNLTPDLTQLPPPRYGASMAYDPVDREAVLFGGCLTSECYPALNDTWVFENDSWSQITGPGPPSRGFAAMAWDSETGYVVLFGGQTGTASSTTRYYGDTWSFVHNRWSNLTGKQVGSGPSSRSQAALASTPGTDPVLFGGTSSRGLLADTWTFEDGSWSNETTATGPSPRLGAALAGDPNNGVDYLFGGFAAGSYLSDTWGYSDGSWTRLSVAGPPGTFGAGFAWDPTSDRLILYGGAVSQNGQTGTTNAYWLFDGTGWSLINPAAPTPFPWIAVIVVVIFAVIFPAEFVFLRRRQQKRENELNRLLPEPLPGSVTWYPTDPPDLVNRWVRRQLLVMYAVLLPMGVLLTIVLLASGLGQSAIFLATFLWVVILGIPALARRPALRNSTQRVGLFDGGIIVQSSARTRRIPWDYVQPPMQVLKGPWVLFRYSFPGKQIATAIGGGFAVSRDQARAILSVPRAAGWNVSPPVRSALGLEVGSLASAGIPPASVPSSGQPQPPPGYVPTPPPSPSSVASPRPPPSPSPATPFSPPLYSTVAQLRRCPRCGSLASTRARFCPKCGQPLQ